jgi:adenylate kinase
MIKMKDKPKAVIMFGSPGSGKGTQSKLLGFQHFSTGDILRNSELGREFLTKNPGSLVPDEMVNQIIMSRISDLMGRADDNKDFIMDGYPRTVEQADLIVPYLRERDIDIIVIHLDVSLYTVIRRMRERGRPDDTAETIGKRMNVYVTQTVPVYERLIESGCQHHLIDASGTPKDVSNEIDDYVFDRN